MGTDGARQNMSLLFPLCDGDGAAGRVGGGVGARIEPDSTASQRKALFGAWHDGKEIMAGGAGWGSQTSRRNVKVRG